MKFKEMRQTHLGELAEELILNEFVHSKGSVPYRPGNDCSHPIDSINLKPNGEVWAMDMKCKPRRLYYEDTGIDLKYFNTYSKIDASTPVYLLFVDTATNSIYGNWLRKLTPNFQGNLVYFPLNEMIEYRKLTSVESASLKELSTSNYYK
jgi:hypothetical protein